MATTKSIKIQKNKIMTYTVNKDGFKTVCGSMLINNNDTINISLKRSDSADSPFQLGDRLFGISYFVDYFTPSGSYDVDSLKYLSIKQTTGTSLSQLQVVKSTWITQVETTLGILTAKGTSKTFIFTYDGTYWNLTGATTLSNVNLEDYGISFTGTVASGDVITVVETQYNKFACFLLDSTYRNNKYFYNSRTQFLYNTSDYESGTYAMEKAEEIGIANFEALNYCKNIGTFFINENIKITPVIPGMEFLKNIATNRAIYDELDPTISTSGKSISSTSWWSNGRLRSSSLSLFEGCYYTSYYRNNWVINDGFFLDGSYINSTQAIIPIFEVPVF